MAAPPQGGQGNDNSAGMLWAVAGIFAALALIWYVFKSYIVFLFLTLKLYEVDLLNAVSNDRFFQLKTNIAYGATHPANVQFNDLILLATGVGDWLRYPIVVILVILAFIVYLANSTRVFTRIYSMRDFATLEKANWPQITPVVGLDLVKTDLDKGPWAMAMTPMQFCKRYKLLEEVRPERQEGMGRKDWDKVEVILKRGVANRVFALQLGPLWEGIDKVPLYTRGLFAIFAARMNADSKDTARLLAQFSASSTSKLDFSGVDELLKKHLNSKSVQNILQSHAYVLTVMASMLTGAREDGVQASADFLWLKPLDRRLWYTLNTVGRQTPFSEVAGVYAHWKAELEAGRKLIVPMVEEATKALEVALKEVIYRADEK